MCSRSSTLTPWSELQLRTRAERVTTFLEQQPHHPLRGVNVRYGELVFIDVLPRDVSEPLAGCGA